MSDPNDTVLWAIDVLRRYAPDPLTDECEPEPIEPRDAEQFFLEEQCPSDSNFR
jgi:hypothetical protein